MKKDIHSIRDRAVISHDENVDYFLNEYKSSSISLYSSAFNYGRKKLNEDLYAFIGNTVPKNGKILDIGCGTGEYLRVLNQKGYQCAGIEPAPAMREQAKKINPNVTVLDATIDALPFENNSFDFVMAVEVLRYLHPRDIEKGYREIFRVLKPGGTFYVSHVNQFSLDGFMIFDKVQKLISGDKSKRPYCHFTNPSKEMNIIKEVGFQKIQSSSAMLAPLRFIYKLSNQMGESVSKMIEPVDELANRADWHKKFAGHLMITAQKP